MMGYNCAQSSVGARDFWIENADPLGSARDPRNCSVTRRFTISAKTYRPFFRWGADPSGLTRLPNHALDFRNGQAELVREALPALLEYAQRPPHFLEPCDGW